MHTALFFLLLSILTLGLLGGPVRAEWTGAPSRVQGQNIKRYGYGGRLAAPGWVPPPPSRDVEARANLYDEHTLEKRVVGDVVIRDSPLDGRSAQDGQIEDRALEARIFGAPWRTPASQGTTRQNGKRTLEARWNWPRPWRKPAPRDSITEDLK